MLQRFQITEVFDEGEVQRIAGRGLAGERFDKDFALTRLQGHGLTSTPKPGAVGLAVFPQGDRRRGYLLGLETGGLRPKNTASGGTVIYGADGEAVSLVQRKIRIVSADIEIVGNVAISGGTLKHEGKDISSTHKHTGVTPGGGLTGVPQ